MDTDPPEDLDALIDDLQALRVKLAALARAIEAAGDFELALAIRAANVALGDALPDPDV